MFISELVEINRNDYWFYCFYLQRKETLLKEYKQKNKSNKLIDRRLGEYDAKMAPEDKILQRFTVERQVSDGIIWKEHGGRCGCITSYIVHFEFLRLGLQLVFPLNYRRET